MGHAADYPKYFKISAIWFDANHSIFTAYTQHIYGLNPALKKQSKVFHGTLIEGSDQVFSVSFKRNRNPEGS
jgi:hypothetical protein